MSTSTDLYVSFNHAEDVFGDRAQPQAHREEELRALLQEVRALPDWVIGFFTSSEISKIPTCPLVEKQVRMVVHAYNLERMGIKLGLPQVYHSKRRQLLKIGNIVAEKLKEEGHLLRELDCQSAKMTHLPIEATQLCQLSTLVLTGNPHIRIPQEIASAQPLRVLFLNSCNLSEFPPAILALSWLRCLDLSENNIDSFPHRIGGFSHLKRLNVSKNKITSIPPAIGALTKLRGLDVSHNLIQSIPPEVSYLTNLECLLLQDNPLSSIAPQVGTLPKLEEVIIDTPDLWPITPWQKVASLFSRFLSLQRWGLLKMVETKDPSLVYVGSSTENSEKVWLRLIEEVCSL